MKPAADSWSYRHADENRKKMSNCRWTEDCTRQPKAERESRLSNNKKTKTAGSENDKRLMWIVNFISCPQAGKKRLQLLYLHGNVGDGGGGQVKVLLHQNVEFGGQVTSCADAVDLAGEQGRDLRADTEEEDAGEKRPMCDSCAGSGRDSPLSSHGRSLVCLRPVGRCESGPARTAGWPSG